MAGKQDETSVISDRPAAALPAVLTCALRPLPTWPLQLALQRLADSIVTRHAALLERLDADGARRFGIQPHDLPFALVMEVQDGRVRLSVVPQLDHERLDARISGNFLALLDLVDGRRDGDALFFSRNLAVEMAQEGAQIPEWRQVTDGGHPSQHMKRAVLRGPRFVP